MKSHSLSCLSRTSAFCHHRIMEWFTLERTLKAQPVPLLPWAGMLSMRPGCSKPLANHPSPDSKLGVGLRKSPGREFGVGEEADGAFSEI